MSLNIDGVLSENSPESVKIGVLEFKSIVSLGVEYRSADGGEDVIRPRTVANSYTPQGYTDLPRMTVVTVLLDVDNAVAELIAHGYYNHNGSGQPLSDGSNAALTAEFKFVEKRVDDLVRTVSFVAANSKIAAVKTNAVNLDKPTTEIKIFSYGLVSYGLWQTRTVP
ncbi:MAG: hypothetical protein LBH74_07210 [Nitrososphaerota archaeon]|jgi:hypothetical protein|nr:hypothetical protein [Nitrososphaerota archaeon]